MEETAEPKNKGGRPHIVEGEPSVRLGPFAINAGLANWFKGYAATTGLSQGACLREALIRLRRAHSRRTKAS